MTLKKEMFQLEKRIQRLLNSIDVSIGLAHRDSYREVRHLIADIYERYEPDSVYSEILKYNRLHNLELGLDNEARRLNKNIKGIIRLGLHELYTTTYNGSFDSLKTATSITGIQKDLQAYQVLSRVNGGLHYEERLSNHSRETAYNITRAVKEGMYRGDTYKTIASSIRETTSVSANRASLIARTEGKRVISEAQLEVMNTYAHKVDIIKIWETCIDSRVRPRHRIMQGQTVPYNQPFIMPDGSEAMAPGLSSNISDNMRERCWMRIEVL